MPATSPATTFTAGKSSSQVIYTTDVHSYLNGRRTVSKRECKQCLLNFGPRSAFPSFPNHVLQNLNAASDSCPGSRRLHQNLNAYVPGRRVKSTHRPRPEGKAAARASDSMLQAYEEVITAEARKLREELTGLTQSLYDLNRPDDDDDNEGSSREEKRHGLAEPCRLNTGASAALPPQQNPPPPGPSKVFPVAPQLQMSRNVNAFYSADDARYVEEEVFTRRAPVRHMATSISRGFIPRSIFFYAPCRTVAEFSCENEDLVLEYTPLIRHSNDSLAIHRDSIFVTSDHESWVIDSTFPMDSHCSTLERSLGLEHTAVSNISKSHSTLSTYSHCSMSDQFSGLEHEHASEDLDFLDSVSSCSIECDLTSASAASFESMGFVSPLSDRNLSLLNTSCPNDCHCSTWERCPCFEHGTASCATVIDNIRESANACFSTSDPAFYRLHCPADWRRSTKEPRMRRDHVAINVPDPASEHEASDSLTFVTSLDESALPFPSVSSSYPDSSAGINSPSSSKTTLADEAGRAMEQLTLQPTPETREGARNVSAGSSEETLSPYSKPYLKCLFRFITFSLPFRRKSGSRRGIAAQRATKQSSPKPELRRSKSSVGTAAIGITAKPNTIDAAVESS